MFHTLALTLEMKSFLNNLFRTVWCKNCYWMKIRCINVFIVFEQVNRGEMLGGVSLLDTSCIVVKTVLR